MEKDEGRLDSSAKFVQKGVSCRKQFVHEIRGSKRDHMVTLAATNFILFYLVDEKFVAPSVTIGASRENTTVISFRLK